jgi:hypothetical protein
MLSCIYISEKALNIHQNEISLKIADSKRDISMEM